MKTVMLVFGTRPEAIKMAPLVKTLESHADEFRTLVCVTGQHRQMLDQVLDIFHIRPDFDLNIMRAGQDLYDVTTKVLTGMREVLTTARPDIVLVHGDTTTSMSAALAAFYARIPVGHVEAGLRTHDVLSPWPEEMNRQLTAHLATYHFAPTPLSRENLMAENVPDERIRVTGNTVIDALHWVVGCIQADTRLGADIENNLRQAGYDVGRLTGGRRLVLITGHRRENFGTGFLSMCRAIKALTERYPEVDFVYPMHLNPNVRDSGGIQEEAPGLGKPVLVMRDTTERPEAVRAGTVKLVGTDFNRIVSEVTTLLDKPSAYRRMSQAVNPYGDGHACERIVDALRELNRKTD